jgi:hypothetical protein
MITSHSPNSRNNHLKFTKRSPDASHIHQTVALMIISHSPNRRRKSPHIHGTVAQSPHILRTAGIITSHSPNGRNNQLTSIKRSQRSLHICQTVAIITSRSPNGQPDDHLTSIKRSPNPSYPIIQTVTYTITSLSSKNRLKGHLRSGKRSHARSYHFDQNNHKALISYRSNDQWSDHLTSVHWKMIWTVRSYRLNGHLLSGGRSFKRSSLFDQNTLQTIISYRLNGHLYRPNGQLHNHLPSIKRSPNPSYPLIQTLT